MVVRPTLPLLLTLLPGCVAYTPDDADAASLAAEADARVGGSYTLDRAFATALRDNPELRAAEARARGAGAVLEPLELEAEYRSDTDMVAVMIDPLALLGLGQRGAANRLANAEAERAAVELATARWRVLGAIAEAFAVDAALAELDVPELPVRADAFAAAGLAGQAAVARLAAAQAAVAQERGHLEHERAANLAELRRLLGLPGHAQLTLTHGDAPWTEVTDDDVALLQRPDIALAAARFRVADAAFRKAVADQYPTLMIGPELPVSGGMTELMGVLRVPLLRHGIAEAARQEREAARHELLGAVLAAGAETTNTRLARDAFATEATATAVRARASRAGLAAALVGIDVELDAFDMLAEAAAMALEDVRMLREARLESARAAVRAAVAQGWPAIPAEARS